MAALSDAKSSPWRALLQQLRQTLWQTLRRVAVIVAFYIALALHDGGLTTQLLYVDTQPGKPLQLLSDVYWLLEGASEHLSWGMRGMCDVRTKKVRFKSSILQQTLRFTSTSMYNKILVYIRWR